MVIKKNHKTPNFGGSRDFKVIDVNKTKKSIISACYDKQHVCTYLQPFLHQTSKYRQNNVFLGGTPLTPSFKGNPLTYSDDFVILACTILIGLQCVRLTDAQNKTRGAFCYPAPRWGLCPQTLVIGSRSARLPQPPPLPNPKYAMVVIHRLMINIKVSLVLFLTVHNNNCAAIFKIFYITTQNLSASLAFLACIVNIVEKTFAIASIFHLYYTKPHYFHQPNQFLQYNY